ncbi:MAG TPA: DUF885 family protein, partial [Gemmatimonadaceae bacterium]|nr:DUF885 family protein [Gemmatimonadaceae bacterium]
MNGVRRVLVALVAGAIALPLGAQGRGGGAPVDLAVPTSLRSLLAPRRSEMRLVTVRYNADRNLLMSNYAGSASGGRAGGGGGRGGGGRGAGRGNDTTPVLDVTVSPARIARLKRFDMSWQDAVNKLDATKLTVPARAGLDSLKQLITRNLAGLDSETVVLASAMPLMPFSTRLNALVESRIRIMPIEGESAARTITEITRDVAQMKSRLEAGLSGADGAPRASAAQARAAAAGLETLRGNLNNWFVFFDGYDPIFSWWNRLPYKRVDSTLQAYTTFLRDRVASANQTSNMQGAPLRIEPAPPPKYGEVPDLNELLALPQDEMTDIVQRFRAALTAPAPGGRGGEGRGGAGGGGRAGFGGGPVRDSAFYRGWLAALRTLDFDRLTRNAQVDYLYMKKRAELDLARIGRALPDSNPRKTDNSGIPGRARGREGLIRDLQDELIPYSPEQLLEIAEREFAWHDAEMLKASREMGFGDNWKAALEKTKTMHPPPGGQPQMIKDLVFEAIDYLREKDLITMPEVNVESQHMTMMTPERQLTSPFFLGGAQILVSFPTDEMEFDARQQSMRGNNRPWSHATAFHEMIPGHNLTGFYGQRFGGYRPSLGGGPFWGEGWPVYWEMIMYEKGFHDTPEERVGALFWRMHRCARIIFSLKFHMGQWSPQEAVDFLVDRVGHERDNAMAEVRRSFEGGYGPLYQAAYLLGAIQLRGLRREVVDSGLMPEKAFHDEILRQGSMPITLLRLAMTKEKLTRDMNIDWRFYG